MALRQETVDKLNAYIEKRDKALKDLQLWEEEPDVAKVKYEEASNAHHEMMEVANEAVKEIYTETSWNR